MEKKKPTEKDELLHSFKEEAPAEPFMSAKTVIICIVVILLGVGAGYILAHNKGNTSGLKLAGGGLTSGVHAGDTAGSNDTQTYKDTATGVLRDGGMSGDGQYHLERPGGDSQSVALTSSLVDLSQYLGHTIKVWGQTQKAPKAAWLMDVGRVEVQK